MDSNTASTSATVVTARGSEIEMTALSARPQITYVRPWYNDPFWNDRVFPYIVVGYPQTLTAQGYMFRRTTNVYVSAGTGVYDGSSPLSTLSQYDLFSGASPLTGKDLLSQFPSFSGYKLDSDSWHVVNDNTLTINLPAPEAVGYIDIIVANLAGYCILSKALGGGPVIVRT